MRFIKRVEGGVNKSNCYYTATIVCLTLGAGVLNGRLFEHDAVLPYDDLPVAHVEHSEAPWFE